MLAGAAIIEVEAPLATWHTCGDTATLRAPGPNLPAQHSFSPDPSPRPEGQENKNASTHAEGPSWWVEDPPWRVEDPPWRSRNAGERLAMMSATDLRRL